MYALDTKGDRAESRLAILLDIDGTLFGTVGGSSEKCKDKKLLLLLMELHRLLDGGLAFVSGRNIEDIDRIFGDAGWNAAGLYGMEIRCAGRLRRLAIPCIDRQLLRADAAELALKIPGVTLQDGGIMIALHASEKEAWGELLQKAGRLASALSGYDIQLRGRTIEFWPLGISKAYAVERLLRLAPFVERTPWYFGDSRSDEAAFAHVRSLGGKAIQVGNRTTSWASGSLSNAAEVRNFLSDLLETLRRVNSRDLPTEIPHSPSSLELLTTLSDL